MALLEPTLLAIQVLRRRTAIPARSRYVLFLIATFLLAADRLEEETAVGVVYGTFGMEEGDERQFGGGVVGEL